MTEKPSPRFDPKMLEVLVCPGSREKLTYDAEKQELISNNRKIAFPIRDGIPILILDEARSLD